MIVAGSAVFKAEDPKAVIDLLRKSIRVHGNGLAA
jgi:pentose-5-phosphate-3-epimerase